MVERVRIDYEALATAYAQSLITVLRNFQSSGHRFLETWVPEADALRSILGILEAARDNALPQISIHLGAATLNCVDLAELGRHAEQFGRITLEADGDGVALDVSFPGIAADRTVGHEVAGVLPPTEPVLQSRTSAVAAVSSPRSPHTAASRCEETNPIYAAGLRRAAESHAHEGSLALTGLLVSVQASHAGITLSALVDPSCHFIRQSAYSGILSANAHGLFETLCQLMENRPIIECRDHAILFLEYELRDHAMPRPVPGIVMPENADPMFALPATLVRALFADYRRGTGFNESSNCYDPPVSGRWEALSPKERIELLQEAVDRHPVGRGVTILRMESPKRVVIGFEQEASAFTNQSRLMFLEDHLQRKLERTLQLCVEPMLDQNRLRRSKEAAAI